jgi:hypothetical protein
VDRSVIAVAVIVVMLVVFPLLMLRSWRKRKVAQAGIAVPQPVPTDYVEIARAGALYLSTTPDGEPLNRVAVRGLGFRARFDVIVADTGIVLPIPGETAVFIPASAIREITTASWTIDRGIEPDGLTVIRWTLSDANGETKLDSYFRFDEPTIFTSAAAPLATTTESGKQ